ncbi:hypothetical protein SKAU_G00249320, partial [Synaphobranchus kaupii]
GPTTAGTARLTWSAHPCPLIRNFQWWVDYGIASQLPRKLTSSLPMLSLHFLALTETWITPDNTATPAALSAGYSFSHTPRASGRGPLSAFLDELDTLLSSFPEDGTPVILLGDFSLQPESSELSSGASLLQSFALTQSPSPATHKTGNQLDLVLTRSCTTSELTVDHHPPARG